MLTRKVFHFKVELSTLDRSTRVCFTRKLSALRGHKHSSGMSGMTETRFMIVKMRFTVL